MHQNGLSEASKIALANMSARTKRLDTLERFVAGTQYEGLPDWFIEDPKIPLFRRAPCIVYPIVRSAIDSYVDLCLGEGRFPSFTTKPDEDDKAFIGDFGLSDEESEVFDRFLREVERQCRLHPGTKEILGAAMGCGTGVGIVGVRAGKLFVDSVPAKYATPVLDVDGSVIRLTIQYPFLCEEKNGNSWVVRCKLFRRDIDAQNDTVYVPEYAREDAIEPSWKVDKSRSVKHGFGFCPVIWYPHMRGSSIEGTIDGHAIHEYLLDEIRAHDFALSQRHRAALYAGDPQWTEIGVEAGYNPSAQATPGIAPSTTHGGIPSPMNPVTGEWRDPSGTQARAKGPGRVWQYPTADAKVTLHTLPGDALKALDDHARDLRIKLADAMAHVSLDPENVKFAATVSGKALSTLKQKQLDRCDQIRDDLADNFILPTLNMQLRVCNSMASRGGLRLPGLAQVAPILKRFESEHVDAA